MTSTTNLEKYLGVAEEACSDLRWITVGTKDEAKAPMDVDHGGLLGGWSSFGLDVDDLREHIEQGKFKPRALGINLELSGCACLDCDEDGWLEDLARLAGVEKDLIREELGVLTRISSPRVIVAERKAIKFLFHLPEDLKERFAAVKPGLQIVEGDNNKMWALFAKGKQVVFAGEYDDKGFKGEYKPENYDRIQIAGPLLVKAIEARLDQYESERQSQAVIINHPAESDSDLEAAIRLYLFPVAEKFSDYDLWLKTGMAFKAMDEGALALWTEFSRNMESFSSDEDCLKKWQSFKRDGKNTCGIGSLYYWLSCEGWRGGEEIKQQPTQNRLDLLQEGLEKMVAVVKTFWRRRAHADSLNDALGKPVKAGGLDAALLEAIANVREQNSVTPRRASSFEEFMAGADQASVVDWLIYGILAKGDSHLLVAPAKEGKTSMLAALLMKNLMGQISASEERIGSVLWFSDDQSRDKTQSYLTCSARGTDSSSWESTMRKAFEAGRFVVDDRFNMTADGIEELIAEVSTAYKPVVVIDSLASVCRKLGMKENDSSFANVLYDLAKAIKEANPDATLVIIHHSTKGGTKDKGALESVRGSGAIVGAVDNIVNISKPLQTSRGGNSSVADDLTTEREVQVNGRIPSGKYFFDLEFELRTEPHPVRPEKTIEVLDRITLSRKAESTHQGASEAPLGGFQDQVLDHLREYSQQEWTTKMVAVDLGKDQGQVSRVLKKLEGMGKAVSRRDGREVFYQST